LDLYERMSEKPSSALGSTKLISTRKLVHVSMLGFAFLLPFLTWVQAVGAALLALLFNLFVLPRLEIDLRKRTRDQVSPDVWTGIVIYPFSVLLLILFYRHSMEIVAAVWAIMALGDGSAGVAGVLMKGPRLPWNREKSWPGFGAFALAGTLGAFVLMRWVDPAMSGDQAWLLCAATALVGAAVESLPIGLDDNLTVPLVAGAFLFGVSFIEASSFWSNYPYLKSRLLWALVVNLAFALAALAVRTITVSGAAMGFVLGVAVYLGYGLRSFLIVFLFFALGSAATRLGYTRKAARGVAEHRAGRRGWREASANLLAAAFFSILVVTTPYQAAFLIAMVASLVEAAGDTISSEIGQWLSNRAYLITTFKPVPAGENGGISIAGTVAGAAASALVVGAALSLGLCGRSGAAVAFAAGVTGNLLDSLIGATLERRGLVTNAIVNFTGTSFAGAVAFVVALHGLGK
jgi:uncharacterized protein (TIGR00297 family)